MDFAQFAVNLESSIYHGVNLKMVCKFPIICRNGRLFGLLGSPVAGGATLGELMFGCAEPVRLPGWANGLMDGEGTSVGVAGTVLAPAYEPGLANGE